MIPVELAGSNSGCKCGGNCGCQITKDDVREIVKEELGAHNNG
jgi:hypothetical protein